MKDEIKEIIEYISSRTVDDILLEDYFKELEDYITNLQTIEQEYSAILSENAELENKITNLQEELNEYKFPDCKSKDIEVVRANLVDMIRKNKRLEQENERLKEELYSTNQVVNELLDERDRNKKAINILELSSQNKGMCTRPETDTIQSALIILKGDKDE